MNRRKAVTVLSMASFASAQTKGSATRDKFVGVWKLVNCESKDKITGEVRYPYGVKPIGRITYDAAGRMSAQLMDPGRRAIGGSPNNRSAATAIRETSTEDMREILTGFTAYFGTFDIDEPSRTVIHKVGAHLIPSWVGAELRRTYEFSSGNQLILTAAFDQGATRLVWQRDGT
jgi:hypothetical protein